MYVIDTEECLSCCVCDYNCPEGAIIPLNGYMLGIDPTKCNMCGNCLDGCPVDCIYDDGSGIPTGEDPESIFSSDDFINAYGQFINTPFLLGGEDPVNGADCSGLIWLIYGAMNLYYPRCSTSGFLTSPYWVRVSSPLPGDIAVWPGHHSGIYYPFGNYNFYYMSTGNNCPVFGLMSWFTPFWGAPIYLRYYHP